MRRDPLYLLLYLLAFLLVAYVVLRLAGAIA